ncbi:hypothetical protein RCL1_001500 [Eukaryota sp. TZLM3-RCL]
MLSENIIRDFLSSHKLAVIFVTIALQLFLGINYSWPTLSTFFVDLHGWTATDFTMIWSTVVLCVGLAPIPAGIIVKKHSYRWLTSITALMMSLGYFIASTGSGARWLSVFVGAMCVGFSVGFSYIVALRFSVSYFPSKKGLLTGLAIGSFAFGSLLWSSVGEFLMTNHDLVYVFRVFGSIPPVGIFIVGLCTIPYKIPVDPPTDVSNETIVKNVEEDVDEKESIDVENVNENDLQLTEICEDVDTINPETVDSGSKDLEDSIANCEKVDNLNSTQELKGLSFLFSSNFQLVFWAVFVGTSAGFMSVSAIRLYSQDALRENGYSDDQVKLYTFIATAICFNVANAFGRVLMGPFIDKFGASTMWICISFLQAIAITLFIFLAGNPITLALLVICIASFYGSIYVVIPIVSSDIFGEVNFPIIFPWLFSGSGFSGVFGPNLFGPLYDRGYGSVSFAIITVGLLVTTFLTFLVARRAKKTKVLP